MQRIISKSYRHFLLGLQPIHSGLRDFIGQAKSLELFADFVGAHASISI